MSDLNKIVIIADDKEILEEIDEIKQAERTYIQEISINHSSLSIIKGINVFSNLINLDLSGNQISSISIYTKGLSRLTYLNISCNYLVSLNGIENLINLQEANFAHNKINNIDALGELGKISNRLLRILKLEDNLIESIDQLQNLISFIYLELVN